MGRPPLPVGTFGRICFLSQPSGEVQARARFRDYDGRTRLVSKTARTRAAAERALKTELSTRLATGDRGAVTGACQARRVQSLCLLLRAETVIDRTEQF